MCGDYSVAETDEQVQAIDATQEVVSSFDFLLSSALSGADY